MEPRNPLAPEQRKPFEQLIIPDRTHVKRTIEEMQNEGNERMHVVADFDGTLSAAWVNVLGEMRSHISVISLLRDEPERYGLTQEYADESHALFRHYAPLERDGTKTRTERHGLMHEWWTTVFGVMFRHGLSREMLNAAAENERLQLREGAFVFLRELTQRDIPVVVLSAGLGDIIDRFFDIHTESKELKRENIHVIANHFLFDADDRAYGLAGPVVHSLNKNETAVQGTGIGETVAERKNVLLFGDGIHDLDMVQGFAAERVLNIGFGNTPPDIAPQDFAKWRHHLDRLKRKFDIVDPSSTSMSKVNQFLQPLLNG